MPASLKRSHSSVERSNDTLVAKKHKTVNSPNAVRDNKTKPGRDQIEADGEFSRIAGMQLWEDFAETVPSGEMKRLLQLVIGAGSTKSSGKPNSVQRKYGFTLTPVTLTEGIYEGQQVLVYKEVKPFEFLTLPQELRDQIYGYVFGELDEHIYMGYRKPNQCPRRPVIDRSWAFQSSQEGRVESNPTAILQVCKQVRQEAAPIIYRRPLHFRSMSEVGLFLGWIGSMKKYLRDITMTGKYEITKAQGALLMLQDAEDLRALRFCLDDVRGHEPTRLTTIARDLTPLVRAVTQRTRDDGKSSTQVILDALNIAAPARCYACKAERTQNCEHSSSPLFETCIDLCKNRSQLEADLRAAVVQNMWTER